MPAHFSSPDHLPTRHPAPCPWDAFVFAVLFAPRAPVKVRRLACARWFTMFPVSPRPENLAAGAQWCQPTFLPRTTSQLATLHHVPGTHSFSQYFQTPRPSTLWDVCAHAGSPCSRCPPALKIWQRWPGTFCTQDHVSKVGHHGWKCEVLHMFHLGPGFPPLTAGWCCAARERAFAKCKACRMCAVRPATRCPHTGAASRLCAPVKQAWQRGTPPRRPPP